MFSQSHMHQIIQIISSESYLFGSKFVEADQGQLHLEYQKCKSRIMKNPVHEMLHCVLTDDGI